MSAPRSPAARAAALRVMAGERKAAVSRDTGVSRSTIDRHLADLKRLQVSPELEAKPSPAVVVPSGD